MRWILASASPRRRELLRQIELPFEVSPSEADENIERETPELLVEELSRRKCAEVGNRIGGECLVLGADTVVALGDQVLGKPGTEERAAEMLRMLSGKAHKVCTGVNPGGIPGGKTSEADYFFGSDRGVSLSPKRGGDPGVYRVRENPWTRREPTASRAGSRNL